MNTSSHAIRSPRVFAGAAFLLLAASALGFACKRNESSQVGKFTIPLVQDGQFNVAFVYVGPIGDGGWTYAQNQGRIELEKAVQGVHTAYVENVAEGAEAEQVIRALARKRFDLIVTTSFGFMDPTETVAREFPKTNFLHIAGYKRNDTNFGNAFGAMEQMNYLAGMIAGARAKEDGNPRLGHIAPFPIPEVVRLTNAIAIGIRQTCPECTLEIRWLRSWFDPGKEQESAESLFQAGVQVVSTGADTTGPIVVASKKGKWAVGYDSDNGCEADKAHCLTVPYWRWGELYKNVVKQMIAGKWKPSSWYGEANSGVLGLYGFEENQSPAPGVPASVIPLVRQKLAEMKAGTFTRFHIFRGPMKDNQGKLIVGPDGAFTQEDLEGLPGCKICMSWFAEGIIGQVPKN